MNTSCWCLEPVSVLLCIILLFASLSRVGLWIYIATVEHESQMILHWNLQTKDTLGQTIVSIIERMSSSWRFQWDTFGTLKSVRLSLSQGGLYRRFHCILFNFYSTYFLALRALLLSICICEEHKVSVACCDCEPTARARLWPSSPQRPQIVFTFKPWIGQKHSCWSAR